MMTFLKTVLIILLIFFGLKFLFRLAMPYLMRYLAKKAGQKMEQAFRGSSQYDNTRTQKPGNISVDKMPNQNSKNNKKVGEYVDYEEID